MPFFFFFFFFLTNIIDPKLAESVDTELMDRGLTVLKYTV